MANTSINFSSALENFRDLKGVMACNCAAPVDTQVLYSSFLRANLVIANKSLFTGQIVNSMANVKQKS